MRRGREISRSVMLVAVFFVAVYFSATSGAGNYRKISSAEGISNNSVLSLAQDKAGFVWFGTCDGLNMWDGEKAFSYPGPRTGDIPLSGNLIEEIIHTGDSLFWVRTNYGLDLMGMEGVIERHGTFQGMYSVAARRSDEVFVLTSSNRLFGYSPASREFHEIPVPEAMSSSRMLAMSFMRQDFLWVFQRDGIFYAQVDCPKNGSAIGLTDMKKASGSVNLRYAFPKDEGVYIIDEEGGLSLFNVENGQSEFLVDVGREMDRFGEISDILKDGDDVLVAFLYNGIVRYDGDNGFVPERKDLEVGVFSLLKDRNQDIIWIGTDGHGVIMYADDAISFRSYTFDEMPYSLSSPVRALLVDSQGTLWMATKGEGIVRVPDFYDVGTITEDNSEHFIGQHIPLSSETVYAFEESRRGIVYIGTEGDGINYYSYHDNKLHWLPGHMTSVMKYIHAIHESSRDTLWVATVGCGVFRLAIGGSDAEPYVKSWEQVDFGPEMEGKNFFFAMYPDSDGTMLFGNRGGGLVRYDPETKKSEVSTFDRHRSAIANDVWSVCRSSSGKLWLGTSYGLISPDDSLSAGTPPVVNNTVHSVLEDGNGALWASTNRGLYRYIPETGLAMSYGSSYGINTIEYSDGAAFADRDQGVYLFGGTNGFVSVTDSGHKGAEYNPPLIFRRARIGDESLFLGKDPGRVRVPAGERLYSIDVRALDYVNGSNYIYYYRFGNRDEWIATAPEIRIADMSAGKYTLSVKYSNPTTGYVSPEYSIGIRVMAFWYGSSLAKVIYAMIAAAALVAGVLVYRRRLAHERAEKILDSKVHLLETVAQELSVPLTMIAAPCRQILEYKKSDMYIRKYGEQIMKQSHKLFDMLNMLNDMDSSSEIEPRIFSVSDMADNITGPYATLASERGILFNVTVPRRIVWESDPSCVASVMNSLIANAFAYVSSDGEISFRVESAESRLKISVSYGGTRQNADDIASILDLQSALDRFGRRRSVGAFRNEMRLAVCANIVQRLSGTLQPVVGESSVSLVAALPSLDAGGVSATGPYAGMDGASGNVPPQSGIAEDMPEVGEVRPGSFDSFNTDVMYILGTDTEIMNFVGEMFSADYNIRMFRQVEDITEALGNSHPDIIICENVTVSNEFLEFIRTMKSGKDTSHIPVILLSAVRHAEERVREVESGVDLCIRMPLDVKYIKASVNTMMTRLKSLKDYYQSSVSAYGFTDGKKLHREDREFIEKMFRIINDNILDQKMTTSFVAEQMGLSLRMLYYRLECILDITPSSIIREYRVRYAEQLLATTKLSIDEIIYKSGFSNRGTFFRNFAAKYGMTPKAYRESLGKETVN